MTSCIKDIGQVMFDTSCVCCLCSYRFVTLYVKMLMCLTWVQDAVKVQLDDCCLGLSKLIQDQVFLTSMVHALEEQKTFTIKDKLVSVVLRFQILSVWLTLAHNMIQPMSEVCDKMQVCFYSIMCLCFLLLIVLFCSSVVFQWCEGKLFFG